VSTGWVAAQVRSRSLASHCVGPAGAREVASAGSLDGALAVLAASGYGERIHLGLNLAASERALFATVLRNLRVLAGWCPPRGASRLHVLAGGFELANLSGELARVEGRDAAEPYDLGSLASVTRSNAVAGMGGLREALRRSPWGDPGSLDGGAMRIALQFAFVRRVVESVPEAAEWAESYAALVLARVVVAGVTLEPISATAANVRAVLGPRVLAARSLSDLAGTLPSHLVPVLEGIAEPQDLWAGEARWWGRLWADAQHRVQRGGAGPATVVAAVCAQVADAWRLRAALEIAARAGRGIEVLDAVA
jgi:hypothetical protein